VLSSFFAACWVLEIRLWQTTESKRNEWILCAASRLHGDEYPLHRSDRHSNPVAVGRGAEELSTAHVRRRKFRLTTGQCMWNVRLIIVLRNTSSPRLNQTELISRTVYTIRCLEKTHLPKLQHDLKRIIWAWSLIRLIVNRKKQTRSSFLARSSNPPANPATNPVFGCNIE